MSPAYRNHRKNNLQFRTDTPKNSEIVSYFLQCLENAEKPIVTAGQKCFAIQQWGYGNAIAGMFRAFRRYRRTHNQ